MPPEFHEKEYVETYQKFVKKLENAMNSEEMSFVNSFEAGIAEGYKQALGEVIMEMSKTVISWTYGE
jgi:hypothetical protein